MNRILFSREEISGGKAVFGGERAAHVVEVLHGVPGQTLKTGEIGGLAGISTIVSVTGGASEGWRVEVECRHDSPSSRPWFDLVLAPPRPRVLKRLLPQLAALGAGKIVLVGAQKVEKAFWGAQLLKEEVYRPLFLDGLMQCGATEMPSLRCERNFRRYVADGLADEFEGCRKLVAHPQGSVVEAEPAADRRTVLAIGPEGGWTDEEMEALEAAGFARMSLGPRILRTETAAVALLGRLIPGGEEEGSGL